MKKTKIAITCSDEKLVEAVNVVIRELGTIWKKAKPRPKNLYMAFATKGEIARGVEAELAVFFGAKYGKKIIDINIPD